MTAKDALEKAFAKAWTDRLAGGPPIADAMLAALAAEGWTLLEVGAIAPRLNQSWTEDDEGYVRAPLSYETREGDPAFNGAFDRW